MLIDGFQVPPFLLPIYQAAGRAWGVPWQVLAAINEIETNYGRNLSISTAGAVGWMQFMPQTWSRYAVDALGRGFGDPYNPVDAVFTAGRYLSSAGAGADLSGAIFAYNHASWYVRSVLLRAQLIEGYPAALTDSLGALMRARFPVAGRVVGYRVPVAAGRRAPDRVVILTRPGASAVAVTDGVVEKMGRTRSMGEFVVLRDAYGNRYTYSHLGVIARSYPVPVNTSSVRPRAAARAHPRPAMDSVSRVLRLLVAAVREGVGAVVVALLGLKTAVALPGPAALPSGPAAQLLLSAPATMAKERLFAHPFRPASFAAGGRQQVVGSAGGSRVTTFIATSPSLPPARYRLERLEPGAIVLSGTTLGKSQGAPRTDSASLTFAIAPPGARQPPLDPRPVLDGWRLELQAGVYGARPRSPLGRSEAADVLDGRVLLMTKAELQQQLASERRVRLPGCERDAVREGFVDRRVLVAIAYLAARRLYPTVAGIPCARPARKRPVRVSIVAVNGIPVAGHDQRASLVGQAITALLTLPAAIAPARMITAAQFPRSADVLTLPDHQDRVELDYSTGTAPESLSARQWAQLDQRLADLEEPAVPATRSSYATLDRSAPRSSSPFPSSPQETP